MLKTSLEVLKKIEDNGFEGYLVGGFVRDYYMKKDSFDVDICTNARPKDLMKIFDNANLPSEKYGAVTLFFKNIRFEITTFRREIEYKDRKPVEIEYIDSFEEDIKRRDFTINTLCMNSNGDIIDLLNGKKDIDDKIIRMVGNVDTKFYEDPFRILRAVRFATQLNFKLDQDVISGIKKNMHFLQNISYQRKKDELNKIFVSTNVKYGLKLLKDLDLYKYLDLNNIDNIRITTDVIGMWAEFDVLDIYPFSHLERTNIICIKEILSNKKIGRKELYKYGLYLCTIAAEILGINKDIVLKMNNSLSIRSLKDIDITADEICKLLNKQPGKWLKELYLDIESEIIDLKLDNDNKKIRQYIIKTIKYILYIEVYFFMKKILFLIFVILTYIILNNTFFTTKSNDLNIKLNNNEIAILFINNGILVKGQGFNNLLVLNNSVNNLSIKPLNLITLDPNAPNISYTNKYLLNNNKRVNNIDYYIDNNLINIKYSNTTFCILMNNKSSIIDTRECNFLYLYDLSNINNISLDDKIETIFISDLSLVPMHVLEDIYDNEIDLYTLDKNKLTAIKINNNDYNIFVIPNI